MTLHHLMYRSEMALNGSDADVDRQTLSIIEAAQARNAADGLTGALVVTGGAFIQVLEGSPVVLELTFERICQDLRHRRVQLLEFDACEERAFGEWSMARLAQTGELTRLCASLEMLAGSRSNASAVGAVIKAMRSTSTL